MKGGRKAVSGNGRMLERDEDLVLFRELHKREKDRIATLLQPVSDEFEPNGSAGNFALYRIASGKKGCGYQFFPDTIKNDYDWLKTPPATPLFPSLEMEANAAQPVVQRELPIIHPPPSRFAGHKESKRSINGRAKSPNPKPKIPSRSITPSHRPVVNNSTKVANYDPLKSKRTNVGTADMHMDFLTSNLSQKLATTQTTKPRSRGVSPLDWQDQPYQSNIPRLLIVLLPLAEGGQCFTKTLRHQGSRVHLGLGAGDNKKPPNPHNHSWGARW
ncbi:hypothetical protein ERO13_D05G001500v2 [Gossypium hirsutum]|uniref:Uncharacterized protein isoform X2 n=1 Tax=Gossypium hirsutum TaxID=3635 RepID=A0A1U8JIY3_GOSHI|nr:uncharacterized protein LOC107907380 isoform X2 [Gossypium hirsutum]KAG4143905.1 hypothetical protein ERO13_D05G001500v2 [Gossypium hirsutum]